MYARSFHCEQPAIELLRTTSMAYRLTTTTRPLLGARNATLGSTRSNSSRSGSDLNTRQFARAEILISSPPAHLLTCSACPRNVNDKYEIVASLREVIN
ncbi:hypothetical protein EVAR_32759_1 [Eumeta japonica]|uniref:Uncharacterized protein n=1 Tax=Eumeta variegata TaxID=151549 RepID=A0A4C1XLE9_EUMVA|nr:hypothetical protein EVAR_32759_1 [Eumeta japonica]